MPRITEMSRVLAKSTMIFPVAFFMHAYALVTLPFSVSAALFRSLTGVTGKGIDELFASQFAPGGAGESDTTLLRGLREKHKLAMAALHDQLDDSDSRYKVRRRSRGPSTRTLGTTRIFSRPRRFFLLSSSSEFFSKSSFVLSLTLHRPRFIADRVRETPRIRADAQQNAAQAHRGAGRAHLVRKRRARVTARKSRAIPGWRLERRRR